MRRENIRYRFLSSKKKPIYQFVVVLVFVVSASLIYANFFYKMLDPETINNFTSTVFFLLKLFGGVGIIVGLLTYSLNKSKFGFDVMLYCIENFNKVNSLLLNKKTRVNGFYKYVYLVNEELFYISSNFIPAEAAREWIDGMIDMMPILNSDRKIVNSKFVKIHLEKDKLEDLLNEHPRVKYAFEYDGDINKLYSKENPEKRRLERRKFVSTVLLKIEKFKY